jgi:hypothetical protein
MDGGRARDYTSRRDAARERERAPEQPQPAGRTDLLELQRSAGNAAVARVLAARQPAPAPAAAPVTDTPEEALDRAFFHDDWDRVVALAPQARGAALERVAELSAEELRYLDDALRRAEQERDWLAKAVKSRFAALKVPAKEQAAGAGWGRVSVKEALVQDGDRRSRPRKLARYRFEISFLPGPRAIGASDEIGFIQTAQVVDLDTEENRSPYAHERSLEDGTHVDRLAGKEQGWYGMGDAGGGGATMRLWKKSDWDEPAWMRDTPSTNNGNKRYHFETAIVCRKGFNAGKVYATVQWGFEVDRNLVITPYDHEVSNKETAGFREAVDAWNEQAAGPEEDRNADDQKPLPGNLR